MTVPEIGSLAHMQRITIRQQARYGFLPGVQDPIRKSWEFAPDAVIAWLWMFWLQGHETRHPACVEKMIREKYAAYFKRRQRRSTMTTREVARATGINQTTVLAHIRRGWLPAERDYNAGRYRVHQRDVVAWSKWNWQRGRVWMRPPEYTIGYLAAFYPY